MAQIPIGKGEMCRQTSQPSGKRIAILPFGTMVAPALDAAEQLNATVANMRFVKPLDVDLIRQLAGTHDAIITVEEGCVMGGAGSACMEVLLASEIVRPALQLGLADRFIDHGDPAKLLAECGLDGAGIANAIREQFFGRLAPSALDMGGQSLDRVDTAAFAKRSARTA